MNINLTYERPYSQRPIPRHRKQRGVVLFVALIVLIAMTLAGVSMMRAVDTGTQVAGNLATRQNAINAPDRAFEIALSQIVTMVDNGSSGGNANIARYSAVDVVGSAENRNWTGSQDLGVEAVSGNKLQLLIDRLCTPTRDCERTAGSLTNAQGRNYAGANNNFREFYQHFRSIARVTDVKGLTNYIEFKNN